MRERPHPKPETEARRADCLAHERILIEEARAQIHGGLALDPDEFSAWLDNLGTQNETPVPQAIAQL